MLVIDGTDAIVGRVCSFCAAKLLSGEEIAVVNVEKTVISGNPIRITQRYRDKRNIQNKANPENSPKWPRRPDFLFKKILSGMLPKHSSRSAKALRIFKAYVGVPKQFQGKQFQEFPKKSKDLTCSFMTMGELSKRLGWKGV